MKNCAHVSTCESFKPLRSGTTKYQRRTCILTERRRMAEKNERKQLKKFKWNKNELKRRKEWKEHTRKNRGKDTYTTSSERQNLQKF